MLTTLLFLLIVAGPTDAATGRESLFDQMIAAKTCRTGKELGLDPRFGTSETTYCRFILKGLNLSLQGVGEEGANITVEELDPKFFEDVGFAPYQACVSVMPKDRGLGVAVVHVVTAKVFRTMKECRSQR